MTRKPLFWVLFTLAAAAAGVAAWRHLPAAYPAAALDLRMDRAGALAAARELAEAREWGPEGYRQSVTFHLDGKLQTFLELEAGEGEARRHLLAEGLVVPHTWQVRHARERETTTTTVTFTPAGEPHGFREALAEEAPGAALGAAEARSIAERAAREEWGLELAAWEVVEHAEERRPGGRLDHTFVFQRPGEALAEARQRVRLVVAGDRLTELTPRLELPAAFERRYEALRASQEMMALAALAGMVIFFVAGVVGLVVLLRERAVLWRQALALGLLLGLIQALALFGMLRQHGLGEGPGTTLVIQGTLMLVTFLVNGGILALLVMIAEGLCRRAFPGHLQLWQAWSPRVAATPAVLGRSAAALLLVPIFWGYHVAFQVGAREGLGWRPATALEPFQGLASVFPWLGAVASGVHGGILEACLFRAVPLAGAVLLGQRFGGRRWWILGGLIVPALFFGAFPLGEPVQPAHARMVEWLLPSIASGVLLLTLGLLPALLFHATLGVSLHAAPIFLSQAPGAWLDRALVLSIAALPLGVALWARLRVGRWGAVPAEALNGAWSPAPPPAPLPFDPREVRTSLPAPTRWVALAAGALGLVAWLAAIRPAADAPPLDLTRSQAQLAAREHLASRGIELSPAWRALPRVHASLDLPTRFVWQEGGEGAYLELLGSYLLPPRWQVRFARFEGELLERGEEFRVVIGPAGEILRLSHQVPEARQGSGLSRAEAHRVAGGYLRDELGLDPEVLEEVAATPTRRSGRTDWTLAYRVPELLPLAIGEARVVLEIAGDAVVDAQRRVFVPQEWQREKRRRDAGPMAVAIGSAVLLFLVVLAGAVAAVLAWSRGAFSTRAFAVVFGLVSLAALLGVVNRLPQAMAGFSTAQTLHRQALLHLAGSAVGWTFLAAVGGLLVGQSHAWARGRRGLGGAGVGTGLGLGAAVAGLLAVAGRLAPSEAPVWGSYSAAGAWLPVLEEAIGPVGRFFWATAVLLLVFGAVDRMTASWRRRRALGTVALLALGFALAGGAPPQQLEEGLFVLGRVGTLGIEWWAVLAALLAFALLGTYVFVARFDLAVVPVAAATVVALAQLEGAFLGAHAAALPGGIAAAILILGAGLVWHAALDRSEQWAAARRALRRLVQGVEGEDELARDIAQVVARSMDVESVVVLVGDDSELRLLAAEGAARRDGRDLRLPAGLPLAPNHATWLGDADLEPALAGELAAARIALLQPARTGSSVSALLGVGPRVDGHPFSSEGLDFLRTAAEHLADGLTRLSAQRAGTEAGEARRIQEHLLPRELPRLPGIELAAAWRPAREVGGDAYDVVQLSAGQVALCIADVVGKGVPAALLMSNLQATIRAFASPDLPPAEMCLRLHRLVRGNVAMGRFITFFYGVYDAPGRRLTFANAGQPPPLLVRRGGEIQELDAGGPALGAFATAEYRQGEVELLPGDRLVLFTDGVTEAIDGSHEMFGEEGLRRALAASRATSAKGLLAELLSAVDGHSRGARADDVTLLVLVVTPSAGRAAVSREP